MVVSPAQEDRAQGFEAQQRARGLWHRPLSSRPKTERERVWAETLQVYYVYKYIYIYMYV